MDIGVIDLFQPKTDLFSTRALICVHFKTVHYFSQPILFILFSYLNISRYNLVIELCRALKKTLAHSYFLNWLTFFSYWIIGIFQKCKIPFLLLKRALGIWSWKIPYM